MADGTAASTVSEVMSAPPVTATPSELISDAAARMRDRSVRIRKPASFGKTIGRDIQHAHEERATRW